MLLRIAVSLLITLCSFAFAGCNACNETLRAENGGFHSPNYPQNYPDVQNCYWSITVNLSQQVHLIFRNFSLQAENNTDNVHVYDGEDTSGEVLGVFYGGHPPPKKGIYSSSNHLFVVFKSDSNGSYSGFQASYQAVNCCAVCSQKTTTGECCSIPFKYKGVTYNSCAEVDHHGPWCSLDPVYNNRWGNCPVCPQKTTTGECCSIPFEYKGVTYRSCTEVDHHSSWCSLDPVYSNRWGTCLFCRQKTTGGACCSIPFKYKGVSYNSCTEVDHHRPWCSLDPVYNNRWGNCPFCAQKTTTGECCSIPFVYKVITYNSCTEVDHHRPWCSLDPEYNERWGNCEIRVESTREAGQQGKGSNVAAIVGPVLACIFAAALLLVGLFYWRRRRAKKDDMNTVLYQRSTSESSVHVKENDNDRLVERQGKTSFQPHH